jgi:anti-sigma factor RsiW
MNQDSCDNVDAFLADDLSPDAASRFGAHLEVCDDCRDAVEQQRWIDVLLSSPVSAELESPPATLLNRVHLLKTNGRRSTRLIAGGLAVAAAVLVAAGWTVVLNRQARDGAVVTVNDAVFSEPRESTGEPPRSTFVGGADLIVVPVESRHPNVTVVRVYPVYQPEFTSQASVDTPATTDAFVWPADFNGG